MGREIPRGFRGKVAAATVGAVVMAGVGSVAYGQIPHAQTGEITVCYKLGDQTKANGAALTIVDTEAGGSCKPGFATLTFNQRGLQGIQGPQGEQGEQGPAGQDAVLTPGSVSADHLADNAVTTRSITSKAVTSEELANDSVARQHLTDRSVGTDELAAGAVTGVKIENEAIGSNHLQEAAVGSDQLAESSVNSSHIVNGSVGTADLAARAVTADKLGLSFTTAFGLGVRLDPAPSSVTSGAAMVTASGNSAVLVTANAALAFTNPSESGVRISWELRRDGVEGGVVFAGIDWVTPLAPEVSISASTLDPVAGGTYGYTLRIFAIGSYDFAQVTSMTVNAVALTGR